MKLRRFLNQNRYYIIVAIVVVVFAIIFVQILNSFAKERLEKQSNEKKVEQETIYKNESKAIISDDNVSVFNADNFGNCLKEFFTNCNNRDVEKAYDCLTDNCKKKCFNTLEDFQNRYLDKIFNEKKNVSFQSWLTGENYVYQVKIYEDMLASGKASSNYIVDYVTIKKENGKCKLNINNYINSKKINKSVWKNGIEIQIDSVDIYKEYSIYNFSIKNENETTIMLDGKNKYNSVYILENDVKYNGLIHELNERDLQVKAKETKEVSIKFNVVYTAGLDLDSIVFSNIINDYEEFKSNKEDYKDITKIGLSI